MDTTTMYTAISALLVIFVLIYFSYQMSDLSIGKPPVVYRTTKMFGINEIVEFHIPKGYYLWDLTFYTASEMGFASSTTFGFKCASTKALLNGTPDFYNDSLTNDGGFYNWATNVSELLSISKGSYNNISGGNFEENPKSVTDETIAYFKLIGQPPNSGEAKFYIYYELWSLGDY